ncbi:MAG TPA: hypothetical protein VGD43_09245 [Micromonospora sp.]
MAAAVLVAGRNRTVPERRVVVTADEPDATAGIGRRPGIIRLDGLGSIEFGDTQQELADRGLLEPQPAGCGPSLAGLPTASPVFVDNRLVLLWVDPSTATPEGVTAGTPVTRVREHYPRVTRLRAPAGSYRFDGLLARRGDRAYLFLHDGHTVRKTIAGYATYARKFFTEGIGPC